MKLRENCCAAPLLGSLPWAQLDFRLMQLHCTSNSQTKLGDTVLCYEKNVLASWHMAFQTNLLCLIILP